MRIMSHHLNSTESMIMLEIVIALTPSSMTGELKEAKQYKVSDEQYDQGAYIMLPSGWYSSS